MSTMTGEIEFGEMRESPAVSSGEDLDQASQPVQGNVNAGETQLHRHTRDNRLKVIENRLEYMMRSVYGIIWSSVAYLSTWFLIWSVMVLYYLIMGRGGFGPVSLDDVVVVVASTAGVFAIVAFVAAIAGCVAMLVTDLLNRCLDYIFTIRESIVIAGGMVGFWIMALFLLPIPTGVIRKDIWMILIWLHIGPVTGCIFGSVGSAIWEAKRTRKHYAIFFDERPVFQFGLAHILITTAAVAVILGISRATNSVMLPILIMTWLFWQSMIIFFYSRIQNRNLRESNVAIQWQSKVMEAEPKLELLTETGLASDDPSN